MICIVSQRDNALHGGGGALFSVNLEMKNLFVKFTILITLVTVWIMGSVLFPLPWIFPRPHHILQWFGWLFRLSISIGNILVICLLVCLEFLVQLENFSLILRRHHYRWRAANFDLCSALMAIEQWGFFSVPHLLWHGASVYNGHLWGSVTLTPFAERSAVELSLPVFTI